MSYIFNYDIFFDYYTNPINTITDNNDCVSLYFFVDSVKIKKMKQTKPKCTYIIIDGVKIYITVDNKKCAEFPYGLHFSIPTIINNTMFDIHYHIGKRSYNQYTYIQDKQYINEINKVKLISANKTRKKNRKHSLNAISYSNLENAEINIDPYPIDQNEKIIYFHKTLQLVTNNSNGVRKHINCYFQDNLNINNINNIVCLDKDETIMGRAYSEFDKKIISKILKKPFENKGGNKRHTNKKKGRRS